MKGKIYMNTFLYIITVLLTVNANKNNQFLPYTITFASVSGPTLKPFEIIGKNNKKMYVYDAAVIRLLADGLRAQYEVVTPPDEEYGQKFPNGTWTGLIKMIKDADVDIAVGGISMTKDRVLAVNFSYPYLMSEVGFVTNKPVPRSSNFAVFHPFRNVVWVTIAGSLITVTFVSFFISNKRLRFQKAALIAIGSLTNQPVMIKIRTLSFTLLIFTWIFSCIILSNAYKNVLLSFLSIPDLYVIRNILDLSRSAMEKSVHCFTYQGSYLIDYLYESNDESWKAIGDCLKSNPITSGNAEEYFYFYPLKKVFIGGKIYFKQYERDYFISEDSFFPMMHGVSVSKSFCCIKDLNEIVHRLTASGLFQKSLDDEQFFFQLHMASSSSSSSDTHRKLNIHDVMGAFIILILGWFTALIILLAEKIIHMLGNRSRCISR